MGIKFILTFNTALRQDIAFAMYLCFTELEEKQFVIGN